MHLPLYSISFAASACRAMRAASTCVWRAGDGEGAAMPKPLVPNSADTVPGGPAVEIEDLHKWYGEFHVLRDINLKVARGERIVICGPSGGGKSTLLRCINRLEGWQQGRIIVDGNELTEDPKQIVAVRRDVGMVFQHFNLFPHLTVLENCTLAP